MIEKKKKILPIWKMFCRQRINRNNNSIQQSRKRKRKGSANYSKSSTMNTGNLDIWAVLGRIHGAKDEVENNTSVGSTSDHEKASKISDFSSSVGSWNDWLSWF